MSNLSDKFVVNKATGLCQVGSVIEGDALKDLVDNEKNLQRLLSKSVLVPFIEVAEVEEEESVPFTDPAFLEKLKASPEFAPRADGATTLESVTQPDNVSTVQEGMEAVVNDHNPDHQIGDPTPNADMNPTTNVQLNLPEKEETDEKNGEEKPAPKSVKSSSPESAPAKAEVPVPQPKK